MSREERIYLASALRFFKTIKGIIEEIYDHTNVEKTIRELEKEIQEPPTVSAGEKFHSGGFNPFQLN